MTECDTLILWAEYSSSYSFVSSIKNSNDDLK